MVRYFYHVLDRVLREFYVNQSEIKQELMSVLRQIQIDSDLDCPTLSGTIVPILHLPEFDSKVWAVAISLLEYVTEISIPIEVNIFYDEETKQPLSIDQTAELVCELQ